MPVSGEIRGKKQNSCPVCKRAYNHPTAQSQGHVRRRMGPDPSGLPQGCLLLHEGCLGHLQETEVLPNREHRSRRQPVRQLWSGELLRREDGFGRVHQDPRHRGSKYGIKATVIALVVLSCSWCDLEFVLTTGLDGCFSHDRDDHAARHACKPQTRLCRPICARYHTSRWARSLRESYEVGAGYVAEIRWERSNGHVFRTDDTSTPSAVRNLSGWSFRKPAQLPVVGRPRL